MKLLRHEKSYNFEGWKVFSLIILVLTIQYCSISVSSSSPSDNLSQWMIDSFVNLKMKAANGSSVESAAVSCGAIRDYYLSKGETLSSKSGRLFYLFYLDEDSTKVTYQTTCIFDESSKGAWALALNLKDGSDPTFAYSSQLWTNNETIGSINSDFANLKTTAFSKHVAHSLRMTTVKDAFILDNDGFIISVNKTNTAIFTVEKHSLLEAFSEEVYTNRRIPGSLRTARKFFSLAPDYTSARYCANKLVGFNMGNSNFLRVRFGIVTSSSASCEEGGKLDTYIGIGGSESDGYHGMGSKGTKVCSHPRRKLAYKYDCENAVFTTSSLFVGDQFDCSDFNYCSGHGICAGNNLCLCEDGISTANCSISCTPSCNNGVCVGTDKCQCEPGWYGPHCDKPSCFGKLYNDSSVCNSRGDCVDLDTCSCGPSFYGEECEFSKCNGKFSNDSAVCHSNGDCNSLTGICNCTTDFFGVDCEVFKCFDIFSNETSAVCSGNGECISLDNCTCREGFSGDDCSGSQFTCFNVSASSQSVCSGLGSCVGQDICRCINSTVYGNQCDKLKCNGKMINDSSVCSSAGECIYGVCHCNDTYYGSDCELRMCNGKKIDDPTVCSSNGSCVSGSCSCNSTNYGNDCEYIKCNGKVAEDDSVCSSAGTCNLGVCRCNESNYGDDCQFKKCNGKTEEDPTVCSEKGKCIGGTCDCSKNYTGNDCQYHTCNGTVYNSASVCSGRGECIFVNNCNCSSGYYGDNCEFVIPEVYSCFGQAALSPFACSGNGSCVGQNNCSCQSGYAGEQCELIVCHGDFSNSSSVCSGNGLCDAPDRCTCSTGYTGTICNVPICYGILANETNVCSNSNGSCIAPNNCSCWNGYTGSQCEIPICFSKLASDPTVCSSHGTCSSPDTCVCSNSSPLVKVDGNQCQFLQCLGRGGVLFGETDTRVCNGRGSCKYSGCQCNPGYSGDFCQNYTCGGLSFDQEGVCSGNGNCTDYNTCLCNQNNQDGYWEGINCSNCRVDYETEQTRCKKPKCDPDTTCNGNGYCNDILQCVCNDRWDGRFCSVCKTNYFGTECGTFCEKSITCSGNGDCTSNGTCSCYTNPQQGFWKGSPCDKCLQGYYGSECSTQIIGPAKFLDTFNGIVLKVVGPVSFEQTRVSCSRLISNSHLSLFGSQPSCMWTNRSSGEFTILFGDNYTLMPGSIVGLNRLVFDASGIDLQDFTIQNADNPTTPMVVFSGPSNIGTCDNFTLDASASFSGDRKPLKFKWSIISSPNNFLSISMPITSVLSIDYITLLYPGEYKFGLQVESSISGMNSSLRVWNVTKESIPLPDLSIIGFSDRVIIKSESPVVIKKRLDLPVCFYPNTEMAVEWTQLSGPPTSTEKDRFNNLAITHFTGLVEATYEFMVNATSIENPLSTASDTIKITVRPSPLSLILYGDEVSSETGTIVVNYIDPDSTSEIETWEWTCVDVSNNVGCGSTIDNALTIYSGIRAVRPVISSVDLQYYSSMPTLRLTLSIKKGIRSVQSTMEFIFPEKEMVPPTVSLISVIPTKNVILKQDIINLQLAVTANGESIGIDNLITREWTLNSKVLTKNDAILSRMEIDPHLSNSIVINPATLEDGVNYILTLKVTDNRNGLTASYLHRFSIAAPPQSCPCTVSPSTGIALETTFSFSCINCQNSEKTLQIVYGFIDDKSGAYIPLYEEGELYSTKLPCSYNPLSNKIVTTYIRITDSSTGAFTEIKRDVTIDLAPVRSVTEVRRKVTSYNNIQNSLKDGDTARMVFNSATISRTSEGMLAKLAEGGKRKVGIVCKNGALNSESKRCICTNGYAKADCSLTVEDFAAYQEIRKDLLNDFIRTFEAKNPFEILTETYLTLQAYGLDSLIEKYDELDEYSFEKSNDIVYTLLMLCDSNKKLKVPYGVDKLLTSIFNSMYNYITYNDLKKTERLLSLFNMFKQFSGLVLRGLFIGEQDLQLQTSFASISTNKLFRSGYQSRHTSPAIGTIVILPPRMPHYLNERSNRRPITFVSISTNDIFGIADTLGKQVVLKDEIITVNRSKVSTVVSSTRYLRSNILFFELVEALADNMTSPINYNMTSFSNNNYDNNLISNTKSVELKNTIETRVYRSSEILCRTFENFTLGIDPSCVVFITSNSTATCQCKTTTNTLIVENVIETIVKTTTPVPFGEYLGIILGTIIGFTFVLCIILMIVAIFMRVGCGCLKRKKKTVVIEEDRNAQVELSNYTI